MRPVLAPTRLLAPHPQALTLLGCGNVGVPQDYAGRTVLAGPPPRVDHVRGSLERVQVMDALLRYQRGYVVVQL
jgi:hypothetical protein